MGADCHLVFLVVLVDHALVPAYWHKGNFVLLVKAPAIVYLTELFWLKLLNSVLDCCIRVLIVFIDLRVITFVTSTLARAICTFLTSLSILLFPL